MFEVERTRIVPWSEFTYEPGACMYKMKHIGWKTATAALTSRSGAFLINTLRLHGFDITVVKLRHQPFGLTYRLQYEVASGMSAEVLVVLRNSEPVAERRVSLHIPNAESLAFMRDAVNRNVPVIFAVNACMPTLSGEREHVQLAIPFERLVPAIDQHLATGGGPRIALNVKLERDGDQLSATLTRDEAPVDLSDCFGLRQLHHWFPKRNPDPIDENATQFTAQYQLCALFGTIADVTMDVADARRDEYHPLMTRFGVKPRANLKTGKSSGLVRADVIAVKDIELREGRFVVTGPQPRIVIVEVEAKGGKAEVRRKLVDRIRDAIRLGAPSEAIHAFVVVPEQQHAGAQAEMVEEMMWRREEGLPAVAEMAAWSMADVGLAYAARVGTQSIVATKALALITAPLG